MAFSSVLGASSVIKPGVCTSTTRPSVPYDGQLIYETDTNLVKAFDGTAFVTVGPAPVAGLQFISSGTFTTASSVSLPTNTFTSTFRNYKVIIDVGGTISQSTFTARFRAAGSDDTTAKYNQGAIGRDSENNAITISQSDTTSFAIGQNFATGGLIVNLDILRPNLAVRTSIQGFYSIDGAASGANAFTVPSSGVFRNTTVFDSFSVISSVASSMTGVFRVYGYADS